MGNESEQVNKINVLHIDTEFGWRGGQQQAVYLYEKMINKGYKTIFVCQPNSKLEKYFQKNTLPYVPIRMINELDFLAGFKIAKLLENIISIFFICILHMHFLWDYCQKYLIPKLYLIGSSQSRFSLLTKALSVNSNITIHY